MVKLKVIFNNLFPFKGFDAQTVWPYVFVRNDRKEKYTETVKRHETTHALQQIECLVIGALLAVALWLVGCGWWSLLAVGFFFWLYLLEWVIKIPFCKFDILRAYMSISFEREAYLWQYDKGYNSVRPHFEWRYFIFTIKPKEK